MLCTKGQEGWWNPAFTSASEQNLKDQSDRAGNEHGYTDDRVRSCVRVGAACPVQDVPRLALHTVSFGITGVAPLIRLVDAALAAVALATGASRIVRARSTIGGARSALAVPEGAGGFADGANALLIASIAIDVGPLDAATPIEAKVVGTNRVGITRSAISNDALPVVAQDAGHLTGCAHPEGVAGLAQQVRTVLAALAATAVTVGALGVVGTVFAVLDARRQEACSGGLQRARSLAAGTRSCIIALGAEVVGAGGATAVAIALLARAHRVTGANTSVLDLGTSVAHGDNQHDSTGDTEQHRGCI
jgi:hypothetical protein